MAVPTTIQCQYPRTLIDLFASRTNAQLTEYCSWRPNPTAFAVDALSISWSNHHLYLFPPFVLSGENPGREDFSGTDCPSVAQSDLVSSVTEQPDGHTNSSSIHPGHVMSPTYLPESSISRTRSPTTSRMACFRRSNQSRGLSERVIDMLWKLCQPSMELSYSTVWRQWTIVVHVLNGRQTQLQPL